ncbi:hypothetical protein NMY22_g10824 [Coprinellus aureogranulatus]|nr:hypothetical protein NMY22_g10824 [Coprinellus aureogranulatus]
MFNFKFISNTLTIRSSYQKSRSQEEVIKEALNSEIAAILTNPHTYTPHELAQVQGYIDGIEDAEAPIWVVAHTRIRSSERRSSHN